MKPYQITSIFLVGFLLISCGSNQANNAYITPQQISDPTIAEITPSFEIQTERVNNCDGANPTYNVSYKTIETQKATFEVSVGAGGLVTGTPVPQALEVQLEAKITAALAKDYGLTTEKNHDITLDNPQGTYREHRIEWKVTRVKGLVEVIYGDGVAQVVFDKIANVELYNRTSQPLNCENSNETQLQPAPNLNLSFSNDCLSSDTWLTSTSTSYRLTNDNCLDLTDNGIAVFDGNLLINIQSDSPRISTIYTPLSEKNTIKFNVKIDKFRSEENGNLAFGLGGENCKITDGEFIFYRLTDSKVFIVSGFSALEFGDTLDKYTLSSTDSLEFRVSGSAFEIYHNGIKVKTGITPTNKPSFCISYRFSKFVDLSATVTDFYIEK